MQMPGERKEAEDFWDIKAVGSKLCDCEALFWFTESLVPQFIMILCIEEMQEALFFLF
jgi:hypothetical protein